MYTLFSNINWWVVTIVAIICYVASCVKIVSEKERAILIFWGKILKPLESGPHIVPWPMRVTKVTKNQIKVDFGTLDASDVARANQANASMSWFVMEEPIRINWGDIESSGLSAEDRVQYKNDPLAQRLTTDPHMYFIFRVFNLTSLIEEAGGLNEAMDRIKDTCVTALSAEAGQTFVAKAIKEISSISDKIRTKVEILVGAPNLNPPSPNRSWGVDVVEVRIKDLGTPRRTNEAVADRSATIARADGEATGTVLKAAGEKTRLTQEGEGRAAATTIEGTATASAIKARAEAVSQPGGELIAKLDTLKAGLEYGKTVILPADLSILTAATSVKAVLDAVGKDKKEGE
jgi:regulator of protease activity HflC (stomatin/prohibitin superfamily)